MNRLQSVFRITIVHEDHDTGMLATEVLNRLAARLDTELGQNEYPWLIDSNAFEFRLLRDPDQWEQAAAGAVEADLIIISAGGARELPECVCNWIKHVLVRKQGVPAALVVLLDSGQAGHVERSQSGSYLRQLAERCRVDFFTSLDGQPPRAESAIEAVLSGFEDDAGLVEATASRDSEWRGWGIND